MLSACAADFAFRPRPPQGTALIGLSRFLATRLANRQNMRYQEPRDSRRPTRAWRALHSAKASWYGVASPCVTVSVDREACNIPQSPLALHVAARITHIR